MLVYHTRRGGTTFSIETEFGIAYQWLGENQKWDGCATKKPVQKETLLVYYSLYGDGGGGAPSLGMEFEIGFKCVRVAKNRGKLWQKRKTWEDGIVRYMRRGNTIKSEMGFLRKKKIVERAVISYVSHF